MHKQIITAGFIFMANPALADMSNNMKKAMPQICHNYISSNVQTVATGQMVLVSGTRIHPFDVKGIYGMKLEYLAQIQANYAFTYMCVFDERGIVNDMYGVDFKEYDDGQARVLMNIGERYRASNDIK
ncbi:hypothetical protein [Alcanivorax nanhaiticus]|nr:hypothetical protein [Alcanivorax nanhaiticus]